MLAENIFTIILVAISNKVYNYENEKIFYFKKKFSKLL